MWDRVRLSAFHDRSAGYVPYKPFERAHFSEASTVLVTGAERVGKSVATAMEALTWVPFSRLIWFLGPSYALARKEFEYFVEGLMSLKLITKDDYSFPRRAHMAAVVDIPAYRCRAETKTMADLVAVMAAEAPDIILLCEPGKMDEDPLDRCRIRLTTNRGRLWMAGTLEEASEWLRAAFIRWTSENEELGAAFSAPLWVNTQDFPGGNTNPEISMLRRTMNTNLFLEKIAAVPAPPDTLVFRNLYQHSSIPYNAKQCDFTPFDQEGRNMPVEIAIDPGYRPSHYVALAIQRHGDEIWVVDEVDIADGATHEQVIAACRMRPWWTNVSGGVIDPHGGINHGQGYQYSPLEIWANETKLPFRATGRPSIEETIGRLNYYFKHPTTSECKVFFDPSRCSRLLYELSHWRYNKDIEGRAIKTEPQKRNCDAVKALGYYLVDLYSQTAFQKNFNIGQPKIYSWSVT